MGSAISVLEGVRVPLDVPDNDSLRAHFLDKAFDVDSPPPLLEVLPDPDQFVLAYPRLSGAFIYGIYQQTKHPSLLDEAINATQNAVDSHPELREDSSLFFDLGIQFRARYAIKHDPDDLYDARNALQRAAMCTSDGDPAQAWRLLEASSSGFECFQLAGAADDLDHAITSLAHAVELLPEGQNKSLALQCYGTALLRRLDLLRDVDDLKLSVTTFCRVVELAQKSGLDLPISFIGTLGISLSSRFEYFGQLDNLEQYIAAHRRVIELTPDGHTDLPMWIASLANSLRLRFKHLGQFDDLEQCIAAFRRAVELTPDGHPDLPERINNLGSSLHSRFKRVGQLDDLEQSIAAFRRALELTSDGHPGLPTWIGNLGNSLASRFERIGQFDDLEKSIATLRRAVELTPDGHPDLPIRVNNLGNSLWERFGRIGQLDDLEQSIAAFRRAAELTPDGHPGLPTQIGNLGASLQSRFKRIGQFDDLEESIAALRRAVELTPDGHPDLPIRVNNLGNSLWERFRRIGQLDDLEQSIAALRRAVELTPDGHPGLPTQIGNLGVSLESRFKRIGQFDDLEQSIAAFRRAVELTPDGHPDLPVRVNNLGSSLLSRFWRIGQLDDLEQSIAAHRRAVQLTPDGHPDLPIWVNNLGSSLLSRFWRIGQLDDLEQSIASINRAIDLTSDDLVLRSLLSSNLGLSSAALCERDPTQSHFDAAVKAFVDSTEKSLGVPSDRLRFAALCLLLHLRHTAFSSRESSLLASSRVMAIVPEIVWLGHDIRRRFDEAASIAQHVYTAVSVALDAVSLKQAVEWLEAGRAIIWSQMLSLRTPADELQEKHPDLAETLRDIQQQLQQSTHVSFSGYTKSFNDIPGMSTNVEADRHRQLADSYDSILKRIRECTGFEDFFRPKQLEKLVPSPGLLSGPVIFLNVHSSRSDAIILLPGGGLTSLALPELSLERAVDLRRLWVAHVLSNRVRERATAFVGEQNPAETYLGHIWNWIVHPILVALNFIHLGPDDDLPHVTWCPTGPLIQLPLHAAGLYDKPDGPRAYDFVVSSYTPSLSALSRCCEDASEPCSRPDVLIVSQPNTPNHASLPGTVREAGRLEGILHSWGTTSKWLNDKLATTQEVRNVLGRYHWVHLACHGLQNRQDPTQSAFELFDGPFTLSDLMGTVAENAEFAFLSACQTAVGDEKTPEESAHLAAGMLAAGYKGVVATMWSIQDADAPVVVDAFYEELLALRNAEVVKRGETGAAYALHKATRILREEIGEDQFMRWVPFVHFGV